MKMLRVGLTGNIGSGKSLVAKIFSTLGIQLYHADQESKKLLEVPQIRSGIVKIFGPEILFPSGEIDRKKLGSIVFSDPVLLNSLNSLLHPLVMKDFAEWCNSQQNQQYIILEAAIILESGYQDQFDKIIHVSCSQEVAIERVMQRDKVSREDVLKRMQFQIEDSKKADMSDYVIRNNGSELIIPQVLSIHRQLMQISV